MKLRRATALAALAGAAVGFAVALSTGVMAGRTGPPAGERLAEADLLAEVMERIKEQYVDPVGDRELMQHAIRGMVSGLDGHSAFLGSEELEDLRIATEGNYSGIGIEVSFEQGAVVVVAPIEGSPADLAGMRSGDVIVAIDGRPVAGPGIAEAVARMRGAPGTPVGVTVQRPRDGGMLDFAMRRAEIRVQSVRHATLEPGYGYVRITHFSETTVRDLERAIKALHPAAGGTLAGLVLDLRNNPGGVLEAGIEVSDAFLDSGVIVSGSGRTTDATFTAQARKGDLARGARIAVLVNGGSASASEIVAGALRDHGRAAVVGRATFGKGSVQTVVPLSGGQALKLTTSRYLTPAGISIQEHGVQPDIVVPDTPEQNGGAPQRGARTAPAEDPEVRLALQWLKGDDRPQMAGEAARQRH